MLEAGYPGKVYVLRAKVLNANLNVRCEVTSMLPVKCYFSGIKISIDDPAFRGMPIDEQHKRIRSLLPADVRYDLFAL